MQRNNSALPGAQLRNPTPGRLRHSYGRWAFAGLLIVVLALGIDGLLLRSQVQTALDTTKRIAPALDKHDLPGACLRVSEAAAGWNRAALLSLPLSPFLRLLGWV